MKRMTINFLMKKFQMLICALLVLIFASCGKDNEENSSNNAEGVWGLVHKEVYSKDNGEKALKSSNDYNPFDPSSSSDLKLVVINTKNETYLFNHYYWNKIEKKWLFDEKYTAVLSDGVFLIENGSTKILITFNSNQLEIKTEYSSSITIKTYRKISDDINYENNTNNNNNNNNNNSNNNGNITSQQSYYVKYVLEVNYEGTDKTSTFSIEYKTETSSKSKTATVNTGKKYTWEETFGPFKKGDRAMLKTKLVRYASASFDFWGT